jgi:hypothetical protein
MTSTHHRHRIWVWTLAIALGAGLGCTGGSLDDRRGSGGTEAPQDAGPEPGRDAAGPSGDGAAEEPSDSDAGGRGDESGCEQGATRSCYGGEPQHAGKGACHEGTQVCEQEGEFGTTWSECRDYGTPQDEQCGNDTDDDCDGQTDEGCGPEHTYSYTSWSAWDECSEECGGGTQTRSRECRRDDGEIVDCSMCGGECTDSRACNESICEPTQCESMTKWQECSSEDHVQGVHGDDSSRTACAESCGQMGAGCAKYIDYGGDSQVCVCHAASGMMDATFPFEPDNTSGNEIWSGNCN